MHVLKGIIQFEINFLYVLCFSYKMLFEVVTIDLHYMTDRQERFDLKISELKLLWKQRHLHLGCPWGKLKHIKN